MGALEKSPKHHIPSKLDGPIHRRDVRAFPHTNWDADTHSGAAPTRVIGDDERVRGVARPPMRGED